MAIKYDNCKNCHSRCIHAGKDRDFVCMNGVSCKITMEKPQTNADRIRAMSIAELNDFLRKVSDHDDDCPYEYGSVKSLEWLEKPYVQKEYKKI